MVNHRALRKSGFTLVLLRFVRDHRHALCPFGHHLLGDARNRQRSVHTLASGHGDRVVEEDFESDVDFCSDCSPQRKESGVVIGAISHVLEDVFAFAEVRLAHPA